MEMGTALGRLLFSALGGRHPIRLFVGISCGCLAKLIVHALAKAYVEAAIWSAMDDFSTWYYVVFVAPLLFVPMLVGKHGAPESAIHEANALRMLLDEAGIKGAQRQKFWNTFIDRYVGALASGTLRSPDLRQVFDDTVKELPVQAASLE